MKRRKKTLTILGAIVASSLLSIGCNQSNADQGDSNYPNPPGPSVNNTCPGGSCSSGKYAGGQTGSPKCRGAGVYRESNSQNQNGNVNNNTPAAGPMSGPMSNPGMAAGATGNGNGKKFNPLNIERIKGEITDKKNLGSPDGTSLVMITLKTPNENVRIILGPSTFLDKSRIALQIGDTVEVKGSRMQVNGDEMMIASEISKSGNVIQLRNEHGNPLWQSGAGQVQQPYGNPYPNFQLKQH